MDKTARELTEWAIEKVFLKEKDLQPLHLGRPLSDAQQKESNSSWIQDVFDGTIKTISIASSIINRQ